MRWLLGHRDSLDGAARRKAQLLLEASALAYLHQRAAVPEEALTRALRSPLGGVSLAAFPLVVIDESDPAERARLEERYVAALAETRPLWRGRFEALSGGAREAGFANLPEMMREVFDLRGPEFIETCRAMVEAGPAAGPPDRPPIEELAAQSGVVVGRLKRYSVDEAMALRDWLHLYRLILARGGDGGSPTTGWTASELGMVAARLLEELGLRQPSRLHLHSGADEAATAGGRGAVRWQAGGDEAWILVPDEPGLVSLPVILHETGHAAEGAGRDRAIAPEFAGLVDLSVSEAWALLFAAAAHNPAWLGRLTSPEGAARMAAACRLRDLLAVRRLAAMAILAPRVLEGGEEVEDAYAGLMLKATGVWHCPGVVWTDLEDFQRITAYIRGFALAEVALRRFAAGGERPRLDTLAAPGARVSPDDFARHFGGTLDLSLAAAYGLGERPFPPEDGTDRDGRVT